MILSANPEVVKKGRIVASKGQSVGSVAINGKGGECWYN